MQETMDRSASGRAARETNPAIATLEAYRARLLDELRAVDDALRPLIASRSSPLPEAYTG